MSNEVEEAPDSRSEPTKKKKNNSSSNNKRRFSDEQIRLLESIFESETKLEPRKKLQLARELGLQPRQIAIWFQNRRARWKSKQIEQDYKNLRANYEKLASCFESLKNEKQSLLIQLQKLKQLLGLSQPCEGNISYDIEAQQEVENRAMLEMENSRDEYTASPDHQWYSFDSGTQFDLSSSTPSSHWFNF